MSDRENTFYEFGPFRMDPKSRRLLKGESAVPLTPKAFETLLVLVENSGRVLTKEELMQALWPDSFVEEANLTVNISALRKALGESPNQHRYIVTIPGRGYRFVADVHGLSPATVATASSETDQTAPIPASSTLGRFAVPLAILLIGGAVLAFYLFRKPDAPKSVGLRSIAVLPFKPLLAEKRDEALEMGIADTLIFRLSSIRGVEIRPIGAVRKYAQIDQDPLAAGKEQEVDAIVDGNIQIDGDKVRVTARLVNVADGSVLWTDKGEQTGTDLFAMQDAITEELVRSLAIKLTDSERERLTKRYTENAEAYRLYLLGRYVLNKRTAEGYKKAIEYFQQSLEIDKTNALAYSGLADCYTSLGSWQILPPSEMFAKARDAAEKALVLDASLAEARTSLALVKNYSSDWKDAEAEFKRAIELNPNDGAAHRWYGAHLMGLGRLEEALAETNRALELDPLSLPHNAQLGRIFYLMRDYDRAIEQYRKTLEIDPNFLIAHLQLGWAFEKKALFDEALAEYEKTIALQHESDAGERIGGRGGVEARIARTYALAGDTRKAEKMVAEIASHSNDAPASFYNLALIYDGMGDKEAAISYLEKMLNSGSQRFGLKTDPTWDDLRSNPRFQDLLQRMEVSG